MSDFNSSYHKSVNRVGQSKERLEPCDFCSKNEKNNQLS